jgi:hypothetical protein
VLAVPHIDKAPVPLFDDHPCSARRRNTLRTPAALTSPIRSAPVDGSSDVSFSPARAAPALPRSAATLRVGGRHQAACMTSAPVERGLAWRGRWLLPGGLQDVRLTRSFLREHCDARHKSCSESRIMPEPWPHRTISPYG